MTYVISIINLKGGVGKTTTTVAMAEILAGQFEKRVLVIDLDPQTNSTTMLIGENAWRKPTKLDTRWHRCFRTRSDRRPVPHALISTRRSTAKRPQSRPFGLWICCPAAWT